MNPVQHLLQTMVMNLELNEDRKQIKLLDGTYLTSFISEFKLVVQNGN